MTVVSLTLTRLIYLINTSSQLPARAAKKSMHEFESYSYIGVGNRGPAIAKCMQTFSLDPCMCMILTQALLASYNKVLLYATVQVAII